MPQKNNSRFGTEPPYHHGQGGGVAVLYCNLGTPDSPSPKDVRRYLAEFLSDPRVVEIPRLLWWCILHGIILRFRPRASARKYASIWTDQGSPLALWTRQQAQALQQRLRGAGKQVTVLHAMRYGQDSIAQQLDVLKAQGIQRVLVLPAYPQYSGTTTASVFDAVYSWAHRIRSLPEMRFVNRYHDHPAYIAALAASIRKRWALSGRPDRLLMSFHGVPLRTLQLGDPYHCECHKTARLLAQALGLKKDEWGVSFQSRLGRAQWLQPYTEPTLVQWAQTGVRKVHVVCPGFTADCLETLEEIAMEARHAFLDAGGTEFHYLPCLNDEDQWIDALADIAALHLQGWPLDGADTSDPAALESRSLALAMGAPD
ncbi:ferrochelatase [Curvibacter sp. APW13]|uniref:ferrochelatase n=1 Tax=Curvibacter sp. APW13 TaxID=3077236 RepID=UPI0028DD6401|nr:ferrochelatase [Curvibacter sp. APW13]MDT8991216.1 ferrochelatase [Curvibacter sp. APW13]